MTSSAPFSCPECSSADLHVTHIVPAHLEYESFDRRTKLRHPPRCVPRTAVYVCLACYHHGDMVVPEGWKPMAASRVA